MDTLNFYISDFHCFDSTKRLCSLHLSTFHPKVAPCVGSADGNHDARYIQLHFLVSFRDIVIVDILFGANLLVSGNASVDGGVDNPVQRHAQQVDVSMQQLVLVLANQSPQLLVLVLHHRDGVFQWTHLHLSDRPDVGGAKTCRAVNAQKYDQQTET